MPYSMIGPQLVAVIMTILMISSTALMFSFLANALISKRNWHLIVNLILFVLTAVDFTSLMELNHRQFAEFTLADITVIINTIPFYWHIILGITTLVFSLYQFKSISHANQNRITSFSIKEGLENLPSGLAFIAQNGQLYLANRTMHNLCQNLTGTDLQKGDLFLAKLMQHKANANCVIKGDKPAFKLANGQVWQFEISPIIIASQKFSKLQADDISKLYYLNEDIHNTNIKLEEKQKKLAAHIANIENYICEEENLKVKMLIHDDFGNLITATNIAFEQNISEQKAEQLLELWGSQKAKMSRLLFADNINNHSLDQVLNLAKQLNCQIEIKGDIKADNQYYQLFMQAISEMLKNSVYHARQCRLLVNIKANANQAAISIQSLNSQNCPQINEKGGLANIRQQVDKYAGKMNILCDQYITLNIEFAINNTGE